MGPGPIARPEGVVRSLCSLKWGVCLNRVRRGSTVYTFSILLVGTLVISSYCDSIKTSKKTSMVAISDVRLSS